MKNERAFSLVEVTIALGIAAFGLIAIFGLLPTGLNSNRAAVEQTAAASIATAVAADLRATPASKTTSPRLGIDLTASSTVYLDATGGPFPAATSVASDSRYRLTITVTPPASGLRTATIMNLSFSWPAAAAPANAAGSFSTLVALDRN